MKIRSLLLCLLLVGAPLQAADSSSARLAQLLADYIELGFERIRQEPAHATD